MTTMADSESGAGTRTLGLERWVQFGFIVGALFLFWFLNNLIWEVWNVFAQPDGTMATGAAAVAAVVTAFICYKAPGIRQWAQEVAFELSKVTWPSRQETWSATVIVLIVTAIAAVILGVFDTAWAAVTDLIYKA
jgi:preprotein translocase subunit SecE